MKHLLTLILLSISGFINAQNLLIGKITDKENNSGLAYVNIGILEKSVGTVSDREGNYILKLTSEVNENDQVVFSYVGYNSVKHSVKTLRNISEIKMEADENLLEAVTIQAKSGKPKHKKLGRKNIGIDMTHAPFFINNEQEVVDDLLSKEMGVYVKVKDYSQVTGLNFKISYNQFKRVRFRVNFYRVENGLPTALLFPNKNILIDVKDQYKGWFNVDLKDYEIYLDGNTEVAVTIQWVESEKSNEYSKMFSMPISLVGGTQYLRDKAMDKWQKHSRALSFYLDTTKY